MKPQVIHIVVRVALQHPDRLRQGRQILLRGPLAGQTRDGHLVDPAELTEVLLNIGLVGHPNKGNGPLNIVRIPDHHLPVSPVFNGAQKLQNGKTLPQRAPAHAQHLRQVPFGGKLLPHFDVSLVNGGNQRLHHKLRDFRQRVLNLFQLHILSPPLLVRPSYHQTHLVSTKEIT